MTYEEFLDYAMRRLAQPGCQERVGQGLFNALHELDPALASEITGTDEDPYYEENMFGPRTKAFFTRVMKEYSH